MRGVELRCEPNASKRHALKLSVTHHLEKIKNHTDSEVNREERNENNETLNHCIDGEEVVPCICSCKNRRN